MPAPPPPTARVLLAHRNALIALSQRVARDQTGAVLSALLDAVVPVVNAVGGLAYRASATDLALASDHAVPRKAKPWLTNLSLTGERWFVAQRVAQSLRHEVEDSTHVALDEHPARPALLQAGWRALAATPIIVGRKLQGVLVLAANDKAGFDADALVLLESACSIVGLALAREREIERERDERLHETRTAQLATVGLIASTVAGELASPLAAQELQIEEQLALVERLRRRHGLEDDELANLHGLTGDIAAGTHRMQDVVSRLLTLSRESALETLEVGALVEGSVALGRRALEARGLSVELRRPPTPLYVSGRAENLHMLVLQLLLYAAQECEVERLRAPTIVLELTTDGDRVVLALESPAQNEVRPQVFDALYQPRRPAEGRGMSFDLAVAKQIVVSHNGHIEVGAKDRRGLQLRVVLPSAVGAPRPARRISSKPPRSMPPVGPVPVVVWIDDDAPFVRSVRRCLKSADTRSASTLAEGRALLAALEETPAMVFCAVSLPDGSGIELHGEVAPQLARRFVFLADAVMPVETANYLLESGCSTLIRPIGLEEVSALLEGSSDPQRQPGVAPTLSIPPSAEASTPRDGRGAHLRDFGFGPGSDAGVPSTPSAQSAVPRSSVPRRDTPVPTTPSPASEGPDSADLRARSDHPTDPERPAVREPEQPAVLEPEQPAVREPAWSALRAPELPRSERPTEPKRAAVRAADIPRPERPTQPARRASPPADDRPDPPPADDAHAGAARGAASAWAGASPDGGHVARAIHAGDPPTRRSAERGPSAPVVRRGRPEERDIATVPPPRGRR